MKVLFVNDYGFFHGGAEVYAYDLAGGLSQRGHEVRWLTSRSLGGGSLAPVSAFAETFHRDYFCHGISIESPLARGIQQIVNPSARQALRRALDEWRPDLVHLHNYLGRLSPSIFKALQGVPIVATLHNYRAVCPKGTKARPDYTACHNAWGRHCVASRCLPMKAFAQEKIKRALWGSPLSPIHRLLAPSHYMKSLVERETSLAVQHFPAATSVHELRLKKTNGKSRLLYVGRLVPNKGVHILVSALPRILQQVPEASLTIAGEGPAKEGLIALAAELGVEPRVRFLGSCNKAEIPFLHAETDLAIVPSLWPENCSVAILESMALGTPVVASAVGGSPELIEDGINGRLVEPGSPEALAEGILGLLTRPRRRQSMERNSLVTAERYRIADAAENLENIYCETIRFQRSL